MSLWQTLPDAVVGLLCSCFLRLNLIMNAYLFMYTDLLINKNNYESFI